MPKIQIDTELFFSLLGQRLDKESLEDLLVVAKAELEEFAEGVGATLKIELNDTNRPDLWSAAGLARQLKCYLTHTVPHFSFYDQAPAQEKTIIVDSRLQDIRPYVVGLEISGKEIDEALLIELIQNQEKLCENFGQKRHALAMGIYRASEIQWPVHYRACDPDTTEFVPLEHTHALSLRKIVHEHAKGKEYGHIIKDYSLYPLLVDAKDEVLSMPPIINSAQLGAVQVGDDHLFIELTGWDLEMLFLATSICACDYADLGFQITRIQSLYQYDTGYAKEIVCPHYFQTTKECNILQANKLLGNNHSVQEISDSLTCMGLETSLQDEHTLQVTVPPYRNDFLHSVDIVEDIMIGYGLSQYEPEMPKSFTIGRVSTREKMKRSILQTMIGLGFQEMMFPYLGSKQQHIVQIYEKTEIADKESTFVKVANPISENYEYVRQSILPNLLETERVSANTMYPHRICEVGETVTKDTSENYGSKTLQMLGFLLADNQAGFTEINSIVAAILFYHDIDWEAKAVKDSHFLEDRAAVVVRKSDKAVLGIFGEIHPRILEQFDITMPCAGGELFLDMFTLL